MRTNRYLVSDGVGGLPYGSLASLGCAVFESLMLKNGASTDSTKLCAIIKIFMVLSNVVRLLEVKME